MSTVQDPACYPPISAGPAPAPVRGLASREGQPKVGPSLCLQQQECQEILHTGPTLLNPRMLWPLQWLPGRADLIHNTKVQGSKFPPHEVSVDL